MTRAEMIARLDATAALLEHARTVSSRGRTADFLKRLDEFRLQQAVALRARETGDQDAG